MTERLGFTDVVTQCPTLAHFRDARSAEALGAALVAGLLLASAPGCAREPVLLELGPEESTAKLAVSGDTLAVGVVSLPPWDPAQRGGAFDEQSGLALVRDGAPVVRTPLVPGALRDLVATTDGFALLRVRHPGEATATTHVSRVDAAGKVVDLPPLRLDALGLWFDAAGELHVWSTTEVHRWSPVTATWERVRLHPAIATGPIMKIAAPKGGRAALVTDRNLVVFERLDGPPVLAKDLGAWPEPLDLYDAGGSWWLVTPTERDEKLFRVDADGGLHEVAQAKKVHIHRVLSSRGKLVVVSTRAGGDLHRTTHDVLDPATGGAVRGARKLPDDILQACVWKDAIVTGGPGRRVFRSAAVVGSSRTLRAAESRPPSGAAATDACVEASGEGAAAVVRALYRDYPFDGRKAVQNEPREVMARYFDERLTKLFVGEARCVEREGGLCNVTFDLLAAAQDAQITAFRVCTPRREGDAEIVDVRFVNFGKPTKIAWVVRKTPHGWRVADARYDEGFTLVELLSHTP